MLDTQYASTKGLKFVHVNCRSLFNKLAQISILFSHYDIIFCSETWLSSNYTDGILEIPGKKLFRRDRNNRGGGVCIYIKSNLASFCEIDKNSTFGNSDLEILTLKIRKPGLKHMIIASLYRPPRGKVQNCIDRLTEIFSRREFAKDEIWFLGDINVDHLQRANPDLIKFTSLFKKFRCTQLINSVTRPGKYRCSCLDWIITKAYIPPERKIPGVGGWRWAMHPTPHFCVTQRKIYQHVGIFCVG